MFNKPVAVIADESPGDAIEVEADGVEAEESAEMHAAA